MNESHKAHRAKTGVLCYGYGKHQHEARMVLDNSGSMGYHYNNVL